jgi:hypothetical protein
MRKSDQRAYTRTCTRGAAALALLALVAATGAGCGDDDSPGPTAGSGGTAGRGGSGGGGRGGSAGTAGSAGRGGSAGTAGSAGSAGSGGGSGGTGGSSAGSGGSNDGDAGVDAATGDAGPEPLTEAQITEIAENICDRYAELDDCEPPVDCVDDMAGDILDTRNGAPQCAAEVDAYFSCMGGEPIESFTCDGDTPVFAPETVNCDDENAAFFACLTG